MKGRYALSFVAYEMQFVLFILSQEQQMQREEMG
jgi:hypothetical protein